MATTRKRLKKEITDDQWIKRKSSSLRSSWLKRSPDKEAVPAREDILTWLINKYPFSCHYAKSPISREVIEVDHLIPVSRGGTFNLSNAAITSRYYNNAKGDLTAKEFKDLLKLVSKWECKGERLFKRLISSNHIFKKRAKK